jgi:hypothetical protein
MMTMDEKIVGVWYLNTIQNHQDWMAAVREIEPDEKYELTYRFRYYKDDKAFDSEDKKNWYSATCTGTKSYVIASIRFVAKQLEQKADGQPLYELINDHGYDRFIREFQDMPFVYMRVEGAAGVKA